MHRKNGFTMMELMIAVVVIGILVSIAVPNYMRALERAKCSQAVKILKTLRSAQMAYYSDNASFDTNLAVIEVHAGGNFYSDNSNPDWLFTVPTGGTGLLVLTATRTKGPHANAGNTTITLTDDVANDINEQWGGTYPMDDPGNW